MTDLRHAKSWSRRIGRRGENAASALLTDEGCRILARNCRASAGGELDIVALDGATLVFTEVKTRYSGTGELDEKNMPRYNLRAAQKRRICRGAAAYLRELEDPEISYRFDLIEVVAGRFGIHAVYHRKNAFSSAVLRHRKRMGR